MNVQSIRNKLDSLNVWLSNYDFNILTLNEHWLNKDETNLYIPVGYKLANIYCRQPPLKGGGSCIFIKGNIEFQEVDLNEFCVSKVFEVVAIYLSKFNLVVATVYRTPDSDFNDFLFYFESFIKFLYKKYGTVKSNYAISGDYNVNILQESNNRNNFLDLLRSYNLHCLNKEPTRLDACIDNIITCISNGNIDCKVINPHLSDHAGVQAVFHNHTFTDDSNMFYIKKVRTLNEHFMLNFREKLLQSDWLKVYCFFNVDDAYNYFINTVTSSFEECCRLRNIKSNSANKKTKFKWFTPQLKKHREYVVLLYDRCKKSRGTVNEVEHRNAYNNAKKLYRLKIKQEKLLSNENYIKNSQNQCKAAWNVIKNETACNFNREHGLTIDSNAFNEYFINAAFQINNDKVPDSFSPAIEYVKKYIDNCNVVNNSFKWRKILAKEVLKCVLKLSGSKSEDFYGLSNKVVKDIIDIIAEPLTYLYNFSIESGIFPQTLKITKTVPIFKKGNKQCPSSYRPIALVPIFSKIFEVCMKQQLFEYFQQNNLLCKEQYGFLPHLNTIKAVESVVDNVILNFENKNITSALLIDLSKAFDCIWHELLLEKFVCYGVKGKELSLITSYLRDRKQIVVQGLDRSEIKNTKIGVPQGSVLGPFLFIIAVNDFASSMPCKSVLYADDTTLISSNVNLAGLKNQQALAREVASKWYKDNYLVVNNNKTECIVFSLNGLLQVKNETVKLLGIHLDSRLSWESHVNNLCSKLARVTYLLFKLKHCVSKDMLVSAYYAFFHSHLLYGIMLWGNSSSAGKVFIKQKKVLRLIENVPQRETCLPLFKKFQIMTLPCLYIYTCLMAVKEKLQCHTFRQDVHNYNTRNKHLLDLLSLRLNRSSNSHLNMKFKLFNKLPEEAWTVHTNKFKYSICKWLKNNAFYSIHDYLNCDISGLRF